MAYSWHMSGHKQGKNVGVIWDFDLDSRLLQVSFSILSVSQAEARVKEVVAKTFNLPEYVPVAEFVLLPSVPAMQFVTSGLANIDRLLSDQLESVFVISTAF